MTERTEWEIVDEPLPRQRPSLRAMLAAMLGPWWRWKLALGTAVGAVGLLLVATLSGLILLLTMGAALVTFGLGKLGNWLFGLGARRSSRTDLAQSIAGGQDSIYRGK